MPPLLFVGYWEVPFTESVEFDVNRQEIEMFHALKMRVGGSHGGTRIGTGWTLSEDRTAAIWERGFLDFLDKSAEHDHLRSEMTPPL